MHDRASASARTLLLLVFWLTGMLLALPARGQSSSNFTLQTNRIGAGGGSTSSPSFTVDAATGQSAAGPATSASFRSGAGFTYSLDPNNKPLPVELTSFEAVRTGASAAQLTWRVASEQNNAGFDVQHQPPGSESWTKLGFVESKAPGGTTTKTMSYEHVAENLAVGTHRFRLRQVDLDGSATLTDPMTVRLQMQESLRLSTPAPNPVRSTATVRIAVKERVETLVTLYNMLEQRVKTLYQGTPTAGESRHLRIDASELPSGTYFLRLRAGEEVRSRQVTVVH